ncbi:malonyl-CoA synthase [Acuticoccus sp. MNP-M23]|uniref:malonate--CoA ligase n=1 Tax=Acuticoccus sp. MNP-M23 TaxID=3072793 RepID=UPI002815AD43|nr:malonyl-CoA synthase [Acuticoccus sp. MNP-M23]WMS44797.1 malonyl-CoA synthase [Acuticoccus sp. MNP-M23]
MTMGGENHLYSRLLGSADPSRIFAEVPGESVRRMRYGDLAALAGRLANVLTARGVKPGDRVAVQADKSLEMIALYLATVRAGAIFLPLNTGYTPAEIEYFLTDAEPALFVVDPAREAALAPLATRVGAGIATMGAMVAGTATGTLMDEAAAAPEDFATVPRTADDLAAILYTSGTTGRSKGAMLSHDNLWSNSETLCDLWRFTAEDRLIHALPIFHTHGLFVATNITLAAGGALIFLPRFDADAILSAMPDATALMGVPTFYTRLLDHPGLTREAAAGMRLFVSGSAPLLAETHTRWQAQTGHAILERYGMTETNMNTSNPYEGERRPGTVGFPLPGVALKVCSETGAELPDGEIGTLEVRGPNVFQGYWRMPDKTAEELRADGFFITGDLGVVDADGYVSIVGRGKDLIISGGFNVYPKEVEGLIDEIDGVVESAVIGLPHPDFGEGVAAVVVPAREGLTQADIVAPLSDKLARYKQPVRVFFVDELPRNTMGKVQKAALRKTYAATFEKA